MVLRGLSLPFSASRLAVLGVSAFTVTLTGVFWYQRAFNANPMRLAKDADGVYRYMTKADLLRIKVNEAEANYSMDKDNEHYAMMLRVGANIPITSTYYQFLIYLSSSICFRRFGKPLLMKR